MNRYISIYSSRLLISKFILCFILCCLLVACGSGEDAARPKAVPADPLDRDDIYENRDAFKRSNDSSRSYGRRLNRALNKGDLDELKRLYEPLYLAKENFVPDLLRYEDTMKPGEGKRLIAATYAEVQAFWLPWLIKLYGESECYFNMADWSDYKEGELGYLQKAAALDNAEALWLLAKPTFGSGGIFNKNGKKVWPQVLKAAELGSSEAQFMAAMALVTGDSPGVEIDLPKSIELYTASANQCNDMSALHLAGMHLTGEGMPVSLKEAYKYGLVSDAISGPASGVWKLQKQLSQKEIDEATDGARAILMGCKNSKVKKQQELEARWKAMVPEIKKDIHAKVPWLVWTMIPDVEKEKARAEFLANIIKSTPPSDEPLDKIDIFVNYDGFKERDKKLRVYGFRLYMALNKAEYSQLDCLYRPRDRGDDFSLPELLRDEKYWPGDLKGLDGATNEDLRAFWKPWIIKLYGEPVAYLKLYEWAPYRADTEKQYLQKAIDLGNVDAYGEFVLEQQYYVGEDARWALELKAAELGSAQFQYEVAETLARERYEKGDKWYTRKVDVNKVMKFYTASAKQCHGLAALRLAERYETGNGVPVNLVEAYKYFLISDFAGVISGGSLRLKKQLSEQELKEATASAEAIILACKEREAKEQQELKARWEALVPEIKKDIHAKIPWLVWTMIPDAERNKARAEFLARQAQNSSNATSAAGHTNNATSASNATNAMGATGATGAMGTSTLMEQGNATKPALGNSTGVTN